MEEEERLIIFLFFGGEKMVKNREKKTGVRVALESKKTRMGAVVEQKLYDLNGNRIKMGSWKSSKTGRHGDDYYYLPPGKYIVTVKYISNRKKHRCGYRLLTVLTEEEYRKTSDARNYIDFERNFDWYYRRRGFTRERWEGEIPPGVEPPCKCLSGGA
jgi:hypothetical protein